MLQLVEGGCCLSQGYASVIGGHQAVFQHLEALLSEGGQYKAHEQVILEDAAGEGNGAKSCFLVGQLAGFDNLGSQARMEFEGQLLYV